jgi:serine O-acetyltransferase
MFDNIRADLRTYQGQWWEQGFWVMVVYRFGRWRYGLRPALLRKAFSLAYKVSYKLVQVATGIDLPCEARVGRNFMIDHFGGIIVSGFATFGDNCRIRDGVTIGLKRVNEPCAPAIGNNVDIGTGAKLLGRITIGDNVLIGANAVVLTDVPANSVAMGVPATIKPRRDLAEVDWPMIEQDLPMEAPLPPRSEASPPAAQAEPRPPRRPPASS